MGSMPPNQGPPPGGDFSQMNQGQQGLPPAAKKSKVWIWVLGGCLGLILLGAVIAAVVGYFAVQKAKEVAGDFEKRPAFTAARALVMLNPEIELVDADEASERITIREKATGKTMSVSLDELQQGKITFTDEKGEEYNLQTKGEGDNASIRMESGDGKEVFSSQISGDSQFPDWAPTVPGTYLRTSKTTTNEITIWTATVETTQTVQEIGDWLEAEAKSRDLRVTGKNITTSTDGSALMFTAATEGNKRVITAMGGGKTGAGKMELIYSVQERP